MSAHQYINQDQLRALKALDFPLDDDSHYTIGQLDPELSFDMDHYNRLRDDIAKNGMQQPIEIRKGQVENGHHRAVIAKELGLSHIPVIEED